MNNIGIIGNSNIIERHINILKAHNNINIVGFSSCSTNTRKAISIKYNIPYYKNIDDLINKSDTIDLLCDNDMFYILSEKIFKSAKNVFINSSYFNNISKAKRLTLLAQEAGANTHISFSHRYNPAFLSVKNHINNPMIIEAKRLVPDLNDNISIVYDFMLQDLDLIISVANSEVRKISANGLSFDKRKINLANVRIDFNNGCVANLVAGVSNDKEENKIDIFQQNAHLSVNFNENTSQIIIFENNIKLSPRIINADPVEKEIVEFLKFNQQSNIEESFNIIKIADIIDQKIKISSNLVY